MDEISIRYLILFYGSTLFLGDLIKTINDKIWCQADYYHFENNYSIGS